MYPTYDVDQRYRQGNIILYNYDIALWLGQYHDIALWYSQLLQVPGPVVKLRHHTCICYYCGDTNQLRWWVSKNHCMCERRIIYLLLQ